MNIVMIGLKLVLQLSDDLEGLSGGCLTSQGWGARNVCLGRSYFASLRSLTLLLGSIIRSDVSQIDMRARFKVSSSLILDNMGFLHSTSLNHGRTQISSYDFKA